ncbi:PTS galactosamine/N-acetylgalactosamine transporter subunit IIA [Spirabiliibacterium falconis]|uniref:PTS galactosamine/N-acetylgalactosamine transporter subunit IIA n=1 Tax=Spirabiliibacterium falconis TaxID=572023 RepID=UPI001AADC92C|nr:PTS galactosamine/N-acetylgalactosamine transporter subunit IIA [Spirabiliibacterium falconis]MBE2893490.1 PTS sugar transporter subunit IIA [Spirabiliibacterium falconis]
MINMIVLGHGEFGSGLQYAMQQIIGPQENIVFLNFPESKSPAELKEEIETALNDMGRENNVLFCCDILGGTPFRTAATVAHELDSVDVIAGTNLQMIIECAMEKDNVSLPELVNLAVESGMRGIVKLSDELSKKSKLETT